MRKTPPVRAKKIDTKNIDSQFSQLQVTMYWGATLVDVVHQSPGKSVTIGDGRGCTLRCADDQLPTSQFVLARQHRDQPAVIQVLDDFETNLVQGDRSSDMAALKEQGRILQSTSSQTRLLQLKADERLTIKIGDITLVMEYVGQCHLKGVSWLSHTNFYFGKLLAVSLVCHALLFFMFKLTPWDPMELEENFWQKSSGFVKYVIRKPEPKKFADPFQFDPKTAKPREKSFGQRDQVEPVQVARGAPKVDANRRERDRKKALSAGLLRILSRSDQGAGSAGSDVFGPGGLGDADDVLSGLKGVALAGGNGAGGLGSRRGGAGGGVLGIGALGGGGRATGSRTGGIDLCGDGPCRKKRTVFVPKPPTDVVGALTKSEIQRVLGRYHNQIKYCYERELTGNPNLYGKVVVTFTIAGNGRVAVANISSSTMDNTNVESCLQRVIRRLKFPKPRGGGTVVVTYPFVMQLAGDR